MKKITKLKICNRSLLVLTIAVLISGVQLEATHSKGITSVWIHILVGTLFMGMIACHLFLHFGNGSWFKKIRKQKSQVTRILWWLGIVTFATGFAAMVHWIITFTHAPIGGVHGKLGFLMIILSAGHIIKRIKFFRHKNKTLPPSPGKTSL